MRLGVTEILLILALALVLFGGSRLSGVGKALGQSIREFKKEVAPSDVEGQNSAEPKAEGKAGDKA